MSDGRKQRVDVVGITGSYTDRDGKERQSYIKAGSAWVVVEDGELGWGVMTLEGIPIATPDQRGDMKLQFKFFKPDHDKQRGGGGGGGDSFGNGNDPF